MPEQKRYSTLILQGTIHKFSWGRDSLVAFAINCATLVLSHSFGLISKAEWDSHKWYFTLAIAIPYVAIIVPHILWRFFKSASELHATQKKDIRAAEKEKASAERKLLELLVAPQFEGCVFRTAISMCNGIPNVSIGQYQFLMKMMHKDDACDCDLLVEMMIENRNFGMATIVAAEARLEDKGTILSAFSDPDLSRYTLSLLEPDSPLSRLITGETESLRNLHKQMTGDVPLGKGHKIEGWLRFKFNKIHPDVLESAKVSVIVIHDSQLREHPIDKMLSLKRRGSVIVVPRDI